MFARYSAAAAAVDEAVADDDRVVIVFWSFFRRWLAARGMTPRSPPEELGALDPRVLTPSDPFTAGVLGRVVDSDGLGIVGRFFCTGIYFNELSTATSTIRPRAFLI